jgi:hypothetical protein
MYQLLSCFITRRRNAVRYIVAYTELMASNPGTHFLYVKACMLVVFGFRQSVP